MAKAGWKGTGSSTVYGPGSSANSTASTSSTTSTASTGRSVASELSNGSVGSNSTTRTAAAARATATAAAGRDPTKPGVLALGSPTRRSLSVADLVRDAERRSNGAGGGGLKSVLSGALSGEGSGAVNGALSSVRFDENVIVHTVPFGDEARTGGDLIKTAQVSGTTDLTSGLTHPREENFNVPCRVHEMSPGNAYRRSNRRCSLPRHLITAPLSSPLITAPLHHHHHLQWRVRQKQRQEKKKRRKKGKAGGGGKVRQYAGVESLSGRVEKGEHGSTGTTGTAAKWGVDGRIMAKTKLVYMRP